MWRLINMKRIYKIIFGLLFPFVLTSCSNNSIDSDIVIPVDSEENIIMPQTGYTKNVPSELFLESDRPGTVIKETYESKDYLRDSSTVNKTAYVYLPYGYNQEDINTRYDIFYLMHGWGGHAGEYFEYGNMKNMFDNMIEKELIRPTIIVSATFYNPNSSTDFSSSEAEFRQFHLDFENHLMPYIEGKYHSYALSTTKEDLINSRNHRGFGGFSLGSVTTWLQFIDNSDYIYYFLPMSGSSWYYGTYGDFQISRNVDKLEEVIQNKSLEERGYFIYHAVGTNDSVKSQSIDFSNEILSRGKMDSSHYVFYQKEGGYHDHNAVREYIYNAFPLMLKKSYDINTKIEDVINDSAFNGFGRLIFPVNKSYYSGDRLGNLRLTWYNNINPNKTVEIANYFKDNVIRGNKIFFDIYSEEEKNLDPNKRNTGLFFFKGNKNEKVAICNAGGGFSYVGAMHDSYHHALELSKKGYNAFALIYRPGWDTAMEDLARAVAFIHDNKESLEVDVNNYSLWGGSAGARMAATLGSYDTSNFNEKSYPRPGAVIMQYTGHSEVVGNEPPTYNCVGTNDRIASYQTMQNRINRIKSNGTDAMIEIFEGLSHGFGLGEGTIAEGWINNAINFWEKNTK